VGEKKRKRRQGRAAKVSREVVPQRPERWGGKHTKNRKKDERDNSGKEGGGRRERTEKGEFKFLKEKTESTEKKVLIKE